MHGIVIARTPNLCIRGVRGGARGVGGDGLGCFFLQGEPQEKSCRESLSEALGVLKALVIKVWAKRLESLEESLRDDAGSYGVGNDK